MVKIKICGIKSLEEALEAVKLQVDYIGFVFAESSRKIKPEEVKKITQELPESLQRVGVFVNEEASAVQQILQFCRLDYAQLHGEETIEYCQKLETKIIKAFRIKDHVNFDSFDNYPVEAFLLDAFVQGAYGGSGKTFDWGLIKKLKCKAPIILAGGLNPDNVEQAIKVANPFAVDVSSGIETNGRKDFLKMQKFLQKVRGVSYAI